MDAHTANRIERHEITSQDEWLNWRVEDVTASRIGALFGCHPWVTLSQLYWEKRGTAFPDAGESVVMRRGRLLESAVAAAVAEERPDWHIQKANEYYRDPKLRLGATPDFYIRNRDGQSGILQTKTVAPAAFKKSWTETTPPFWITLQTAVEVMLTESDFGAIAALVVDGYRFDIHICEIPRHPAAEDRIRRAVAAFWQNVAGGVEPKIDFERDGPLLSILFPREEPGKIIDLRSDNRMPELLDRRDAIAAELKTLNDEKSTVETEIKTKLGDAEAAIVSGWRVSLKEQQRAAYEVKATSYRVLRTAREKEF